MYEKTYSKPREDGFVVTAQAGSDALHTDSDSISATMVVVEEYEDIKWLKEKNEQVQQPSQTTSFDEEEEEEEDEEW